MKCNRFLLLALLALLVNGTQAQLTAFINGKEVKAGATVTKQDLPSLEVSFKSPKLPSFIYGRSYLTVILLDGKGKSIEYWTIRKDGSAAIEDFLKATPPKKKFKVFGEGDMQHDGNTLDWVFTSAAGREDQKNLQVKIILFYQEQTGYQEYGQVINLLEPLIFNVPAWDPKKLYLPYLDLTMDKTALKTDFDLFQNGPLSSKTTELAYHFTDPEHNQYTVFALDNQDYAGMNTTELADDFIHAATTFANKGFVTKYKDYNIEKYTLPWDDMNDLLDDRYRIPRLNWKMNKDIKDISLISLFESVEINGLKGFKFANTKQVRINTNSKDWKDYGNFVIYILTHPTNPKLTLVLTSTLHCECQSAESMDTFVKSVINSFKK